MAEEKVPDSYGAEYYATGLGPIPYERSTHWLNFFSSIADQLIRALHPRRVLDAGCAMGFLVEAFWDRGVYCEGIDISEYAISKVRRDIKDYCSVASIADPINGRFDLVTCIEVLEHLPQELIKPAIANLCAAAEVVLFSSTPSDLEEPTHHSVRPPIYWLQLFSEFGFWPDARFDASFLTMHAMVLRKGPPPSDDFLTLFSEYIRYRTAYHIKSQEVYRLDGELKTLQPQHEELTLSVQNKEAELQKACAELERIRQELSSAQANVAVLQVQVAARDSEVARLNSALDDSAEKLLAAKARGADYKKVEQALVSSRTEGDRLLVEVERLRSEGFERDRVIAELRPDRDRLLDEVKRIDEERIEAQSTLSRVLSSRAWRLAEQCRIPLRKMRQDWPRVYKIVRFVARKALAAYRDPVAQPPAEQIPRQPASTPAEDGYQPSGPAVIAERRQSLDAAYQQWIDEQEPGAEELRKQRMAAESLNGPLFSIVVPAYQTNHEFLKACLQSVLEQTYGRWELCVAIAPGGDERNRQFLRKLLGQDDRIRLLELKENGGISRNTNAALDLTTGDFIVLLDHDDTLAPFALYEVTARLQLQPDLDVLYSDHDYLDGEQGWRRSPLFKPDWSPEIMFSANYVCHLTVLRRRLLEEIGQFDAATDGAQDLDLFFRATERTNRTSHIPKILYHWRMHAGSTAHNESAKDYASNAQLLAIGRHMERCGLDAEPEVMADGLLHVRFRNSSDGMVSIVIPTKDRVDLLSRCISTLLERTEYRNFEILILDNGSREAATKEYFSSIEGDERIRLIWHPGPFNYSAVNNRAAREANGDFLLFLNNDVEITRPSWLNELVWWANCGFVGMVGAKLLRSDGTIQHAGVVLGMSGFADHPFADQPSLTFGMAGSTGWYRNFLAVTGACMMVRREVFDELGGFDEAFTLCGSDVELCLRAWKRGYRIVYNPFAELIHHEQQTRGAEVPAADYLESMKHYRPWLLAGDPYWNPNLSLWSRQPAFRGQDEEPSLTFAERHVEAAKRAEAATAVSRPVTDEEFFVTQFDCSEEQFRRLRDQALADSFLPVKRILWFIPAFENAFYGGAYTILRFAESWKSEHDVESFFAICGAGDREKLLEGMRAVYPEVTDSNLIIVDAPPLAANLPPVDASICTLWATAYYAAHHEGTARRFYLIQDFEPAFYRAGSISALVDSTYRMGLYGIANTVSLKEIYESEYGGKATYFKPCVNVSVFYPAEAMCRPDLPRAWQVFIYGRPTHARNAFELVARAMQLLKNKMGNQVRIVSAGEEWNPADYGLRGIVENLGVLPYEDTARLYRESHLGLVMMLTRHPSYIPLELMASGCLAVTNVNAWTSWLLKDRENCLLTHATATAIAETVELGLTDTDLRNRIRENALALVRSEYLDWPAQAEGIYSYLCDPETASARSAESNTAASICVA